MAESVVDDDGGGGCDCLVVSVAVLCVVCRKVVVGSCRGVSPQKGQVVKVKVWWSAWLFVGWEFGPQSQAGGRKNGLMVVPEFGGASWIGCCVLSVVGRMKPGQNDVKRREEEDGAGSVA